MKDYDNPLTEFELEYEYDDAEFEYDDELEYNEEYGDEEFDSEAEWEYDDEFSGSDDELELAEELLSSGSEEELDQFFGGLLRKAGRFFKRRGRGLLRRLGSKVKGLAGRLIPRLGRRVKRAVGSSRFGQASDVARRFFGSELELVSPEEQELEVAKKVVRITRTAARNLDKAVRRGMPPSDKLVRAALKGAVKKHMSPSRRKKHLGGGGAAGGRWVRRGDQIVLMDV